MSAAHSSPGICPHCHTVFEETEAERCPACQRGGVLRHREIFDLSLAHLDCDAFYAAVEKRDNPSLRDKPLIVGGGARGVVTTACYLARIHGIRSAMPMFKARKLCPQAAIVKPRMAHYRAVSQDIRARMLDVTPQIEPISIDEAFLDLAGTQRLHKAPPVLTLLRLAKRIEQEVGITVSVGLSYNKYLAKVASDFRKPRGFHIIGRGDAVSFLADKPVSLLWGVGKAFTRTLERDGITLIGQLQAMTESALSARYGSMGSHIWRLSTGQDSRQISPKRAAKSISSERTFNDDISDVATLSDILWSLCEEVSRSLKHKGMQAKTVHLKLKTADFQSLTRSHTPGPHVQGTRALFTSAQEMLARCADGREFRLIGIGVSTLSAAAPNEREATLFDEGKTDKKKEVLDDLVLDIRNRFGDTSIETGRGNRARVKGLNRRQSVSKNGSGGDT